MILTDLSAGAAVFWDANILVYHFIAHSVLGPPCTQLLERIHRLEIQGFVSASGMSDLAHRLMSVEAAAMFGWAAAGMARRLKRHPVEVQTLTRYRQALDETTAMGIQTLPVSGTLVARAADVSRQYGLLCNDALVVAVMNDHGLDHLASHDADFDRIPGIHRYSPV